MVTGRIQVLFGVTVRGEDRGPRFVPTVRPCRDLRKPRNFFNHEGGGGTS